jgi:elongation factor Ts
MTNTEKVKHIRDITMSPINKISAALTTTNGDVDKAIALLIEQKQADATDMANRVASASIVYGYVHNNKVGAMIVLACQTDFVAKNDVFLALAKDLCMHIVSSPTQAEYVDEQSVNEARKNIVIQDLYRITEGKPQPIQEKIVKGKMDKWFSEICLVNQKFIKDDTKTIKQLIAETSATLGEKIELKKFIRIAATV